MEVSVYNKLFLLHKQDTESQKYIVLGPLKSYFIKDHSDSRNMYSEADINRMLILIDILLCLMDKHLSKLSAIQWE